METPARTFVKAVTWQAVGILVMAITSFAVTGSWWKATVLSMSSCVIGLFVYLLHERIWQRVTWGRQGR